MAVKIHNVKSCCGNSSTILELDKPIRKYQVDMLKPKFIGLGYIIPDNFYKSGVLYIQKGGLIGTASFGTNKITLKVTGDGSNLIDEFIQLLEEAINS
jgi:hypothetical protein